MQSLAKRCVRLVWRHHSANPSVRRGRPDCREPRGTVLRTVPASVARWVARGVSTPEPRPHCRDPRSGVVGRRPVRCPRRIRGVDQLRQGKKHRVVVHPPSNEVSARPGPVVTSVDAAGLEPTDGLIELSPGDADRVVGSRIGRRRRSRRSRRSAAGRGSRPGCHTLGAARSGLGRRWHRAHAVSRMAPAAVTQDRSGSGDRKNTSEG